jgi:septum formation inhibitor MinC
MDLRVSQKDKLYTLLYIRRQKAEEMLKELEKCINETEAKMEQEDVALVKEKINELPE